MKTRSRYGIRAFRTEDEHIAHTMGMEPSVVCLDLDIGVDRGFARQVETVDRTEDTIEEGVTS